VFPFFADAFNLEFITPPWLKFEVLTPRPIQMRAGLRIDYRLRLRGFPLRWQSEITAWEPPCRFVDEQRCGPYRAWVHEHTFEDRDSGTLTRDLVRYDVIGGRLINALFVRRDLEKVFHFQKQI
jgi:ligand-binding SRPBCC domain-containing protein